MRPQVLASVAHYMHHRYQLCSCSTDISISMPLVIHALLDGSVAPCVLQPHHLPCQRCWPYLLPCSLATRAAAHGATSVARPAAVAHKAAWRPFGEFLYGRFALCWRHLHCTASVLSSKGTWNTAGCMSHAVQQPAAGSWHATHGTPI